MTISITLSTGNISGGDTTIHRNDILVPFNEIDTLLENILNGDQSAEAIRFDELGANPATPATGKWKVYFKSDGLYTIDDTGATEKQSGIIPVSRGGLGQNASGWTGRVQFASGVASVILDALSASVQPNKIEPSYRAGSIAIDAIRDVAYISTREVGSEQTWRPMTESPQMMAVYPRNGVGLGVGVENPTIANTETENNGDDGSWLLMPSTSSAGNIAGLVSTSFNLVRGAWSPIFECLVKLPATITNLRYWIGLTSLDVTNVDALAGATQFAGFRFSTVAGDTGWRPVTRDGTTQNVGSNLDTVSANGIYKLRLEYDGVANRIWFSANDGGPAGVGVEYVTLNPPALATELGFVCRVIPTTASQRDLNLGYLKIRHL